MTWIWRIQYNVELSWGAFCFTAQLKNISVIFVTAHTDDEVGHMIGLPCHMHFVGPHFSAYSEKPDPSIAQWDSTNDWIVHVIEWINMDFQELHAALIPSRISTPKFAVAQLVSCLTCDQNVEVRATLSASLKGLRRLMGVCTRVRIGYLPGNRSKTLRLFPMHDIAEISLNVAWNSNLIIPFLESLINPPVFPIGPHCKSVSNTLTYLNYNLILWVTSTPPPPSPTPTPCSTVEFGMWWIWDLVNPTLVLHFGGRRTIQYIPCQRDR